MAKHKNRKTAGEPGSLQEDMKRKALELLESMPHEAREHLLRMAAESSSIEELTRKLLVGRCPNCESEQTSSGEEIEEVGDPTVAMCNACGMVWCLECGAPILSGFECGHRRICAGCGEKRDDSGSCGRLVQECEHIEAWRGEMEGAAALCAWCGKPVRENEPCRTLSIKRTPDAAARSSEGSLVFMPLSLTGRRLPVIITAKGSPARKEGLDAVIVVCGDECLKAVRDAMEEEEKVIEDLME